MSAEKLTTRQHQCLDALLSHPTIAHASKQVGVNERTVRRWLRDDADFKRAYLEARRAITYQAICVCQQYASHAAALLIKIASDEAQPGGARMAALTKVLDYAKEGLVSEDMQQRIEALEAQLVQPKSERSLRTA
jgi:hypothetical protein